jgi:hypothetical protein
VRLFTDVLRDIRKGIAVADATDKLQRIVQAVIETRKAGSLTVRLDIKPQKSDEEQVIIITTVSAKTPERDLPDAVFFVDDEGGLHRSDPNQREMFSGSEGAEERPRAAQ